MSQPRPSAPLEVHLSVWGSGRLIGASYGIETATLQVDQDAQYRTPGPLLQFGPLPGEDRLQTVLPPGIPYTWGAWLHIVVPGYEPSYTRVYLAQDLDLFLVPLAPPLPRLVPHGQFFTAGGAPFTAIECSDFLLYQRFLNGENITPIVTQRADLGFNMVRVFGMCNGSLGRFIPADYGEAYFTQLPEFYRVLQRYGLYGEFTANADSRTVFTNGADQTAVWMRLGTIFPLIQNALVECVNENDQPINTLWTDLVRMRDVCAAHGSNGSQAAPVRPTWDYETVHLNSAFEWQRKTGHWPYECSNGANGLAASHVPVMANENTRYPDNDSSMAHAQDAAAGAALLCAGSCFHSVRGKASQVWDGVELDAAQAWVTGARSVSLTCQPGAYRRIDPPDPYLRIYQRGTADTCIARIRP